MRGSWFLIFALAGCAAVNIADLGGGHYRVSYGESRGDQTIAVEAMDFRAKRFCPYGYRKILDTVESTEGGTPEYVWVIRCLEA